MNRQALLALAVLLTGCEAGPPGEFATNQQVTLRRWQAEDSPVVAVLPRGTPVVPVGPVSADCMCWKVSTYAGTGWLYLRYIDGPGPGVPPGSGVIPPATPE
ncbi:MAG TPA: hypothetical protein VFA12_17650 [Stellaceae bacterium]|nr:hypothetical protein [Stellaceae bacterium]